MNEFSTNVLVVGAGPSGIITAAACLSAGLDVVLLEQAPTIGGWLGRVCGANSIVGPPSSLTLSDAGFKIGLEKTTVDVAKSYLAAFAAHSGLTESTRLQCRLIHLSCCATDVPGTAKKRWQATYEDLANGKCSTYQAAADTVVLCTGHGTSGSLLDAESNSNLCKGVSLPPNVRILLASTALISDVAYSSSSGGGPAVAVLGNGTSAHDCASALALLRGGRGVALVGLEGEGASVSVTGGRSLLESARRRALNAALQPHPTLHPPGLLSRALRAPTKRRFWAYVKDRLAVAQGSSGGAAAVSGGVVFNPMASGSAVAGELKPAVVLWAPSFRDPRVLSFLEPEMKEALLQDDAEQRQKSQLQHAADQLVLHRGMIHPNVPGLAFVGWQAHNSTPLLVLELQAQWLVALLTGRLTPPTPTDMRLDIARQRQWRSAALVSPLMSTHGSLARNYDGHEVRQLLNDLVGIVEVQPRVQRQQHPSNASNDVIWSSNVLVHVPPCESTRLRERDATSTVLYTAAAISQQPSVSEAKGTSTMPSTVGPSDDQPATSEASRLSPRIRGGLFIQRGSPSRFQPPSTAVISTATANGRGTESQLPLLMESPIAQPLGRRHTLSGAPCLQRSGDVKGSTNPDPRLSTCGSAGSKALFTNGTVSGSLPECLESPLGAVKEEAPELEAKADVEEKEQGEGAAAGIVSQGGLVTTPTAVSANAGMFADSSARPSAAPTARYSPSSLPRMKLHPIARLSSVVVSSSRGGVSCSGAQFSPIARSPAESQMQQQSPQQSKLQQQLQKGMSSSLAQPKRRAAPRRSLSYADISTKREQPSMGRATSYAVHDALEAHISALQSHLMNPSGSPFPRGSASAAAGVQSPCRSMTNSGSFALPSTPTTSKHLQSFQPVAYSFSRTDNIAAGMPVAQSNSPQNAPSPLFPLMYVSRCSVVREDTDVQLPHARGGGGAGGERGEQMLQQSEDYCHRLVVAENAETGCFGFPGEPSGSTQTLSRSLCHELWDQQLLQHPEKQDNAQAGATSLQGQTTANLIAAPSCNHSATGMGTSINGGAAAAVRRRLPPRRSHTVSSLQPFGSAPVPTARAEGRTNHSARLLLPVMTPLRHTPVAHAPRFQRGSVGVVDANDSSTPKSGALMSKDSLPDGIPSPRSNGGSGVIPLSGSFLPAGGGGNTAGSGIYGGTSRAVALPRRKAAGTGGTGGTGGSGGFGCSSPLGSLLGSAAEAAKLSYRERIGEGSPSAVEFNPFLQPRRAAMGIEALATNTTAVAGGGLYFSSLYGDTEPSRCQPSTHVGSFGTSPRTTATVHVAPDAANNSTSTGCVRADTTNATNATNATSSSAATTALVARTRSMQMSSIISALPKSPLSVRTLCSEHQPNHEPAGSRCAAASPDCRASERRVFSGCDTNHMEGRGVDDGEVAVVSKEAIAGCGLGKQVLQNDSEKKEDADPEDDDGTLFFDMDAVLLLRDAITGPTYSKSSKAVLVAPSSHDVSASAAKQTDGKLSTGNDHLVDSVRGLQPVMKPKQTAVAAAVGSKVHDYRMVSTVDTRLLEAVQALAAATGAQDADTGGRAVGIGGESGGGLVGGMWMDDSRDGVASSTDPHDGRRGPAWVVRKASQARQDQLVGQISSWLREALVRKVTGGLERREAPAFDELETGFEEETLELFSPENEDTAKLMRTASSVVAAAVASSSRPPASCRTSYSSGLRQLTSAGGNTDASTAAEDSDGTRGLVHKGFEANLDAATAGAGGGRVVGVLGLTQGKDATTPAAGTKMHGVQAVLHRRIGQSLLGRSQTSACCGDEYDTESRGPMGRSTGPQQLPNLQSWGPDVAVAAAVESVPEVRPLMAALPVNVRQKRPPTKTASMSGGSFRNLIQTAAADAMSYFTGPAAAAEAAPWMPLKSPAVVGN